ncbi:putative disease resistance RPP13-like protein 1 [Lycium barbarum]|uniref:putative disease resistance RPP13-like protein 1 n=1 Tax=Lycium barbarum TaxID=112863 RepID=UPI00293E9530|nr:putative disease resistance RPP13-like protein 1 [Lycium barbarum]XP_060195671.1 putative disease resistance RPP13-like protein 1 [Lycium barbarum]XP_060195672.1 putative disease resistance RPP13-like protein 1 [Lycium barbarum]
MELELLQSTLKELLVIKKLEKRKILVVLDDFWSEEHEDWEKFYAPFKGSKNSKVIITTRSSKVSSVVGAEAFHLPTLSDEDCWEIMRQRPFLNHQLHNWEEVGFQIAKKCKGLALVAKMLGELIHCIPDEEWDSILKSKLGDLPQYQKTVVPVFLRSYYSLPPHLKKCFAYCSLFPPGHEFEMNTLVLLWMAEGLIQPISERRQEDIGREYFNDLLCRSFFNIPNEDPHIEKKIYKMHEFTLHMAQLISSSICHRVEDPSSYSVLENVRHLSLCYGDAQSMELQRFPKCEKVRTLMWLCAGDIGKQVSFLLKRFTILRVLDLKSGGITVLPYEVGFLRYLRYLNVSNNSICCLPQSITELSRLQTLVLKNCPLLTSLLENFSNLTSLRHLEFDIKEQLERMPIRFGNLVNLQSLDAFIVESGDGYTIQELKDMTCLQGSVCITKLENIRDKEAADSAFLNLKTRINKLELEWIIPGDGNVHLEVLTGLQAHRNLKELIITLYCGYSFPSWVSESYMLRVVHLRRCLGCKTLPSLGKLKFLECLILESMPSLRVVDHGFVGIDGSVGFQSLKSLSFVDMPQLTRWVCLGCLHMPKLLT